MKIPLLFLILLPLFSSCKPEKEVPEPKPEPKPENIVYENITATDALNRTLPSWEEVGDLIVLIRGDLTEV